MTKTTAVAKNRMDTEGRENGKKNGKKNAKESPPVIQKEKQRMINIPPVEQGELLITIKGDSPLLVNNKMNVAESIAEQYSGKGKSGYVKPGPVSDDERYAMAFYTMPSSKFPAPSPKGKYGIPASGLKKCADKAIRTTGINDNTTIGVISRSFRVMADEAGLCKLKFSRLTRDVRPVNIGSGQKTVPQMRHRPMFHDWSVDLRIRYNTKVITDEQIVNLLMHAGLYIGWGELRAEKKQGECGGFMVATSQKN